VCFHRRVAQLLPTSTIRIGGQDSGIAVLAMYKASCVENASLREEVFGLRNEVSGLRDDIRRLKEAAAADYEKLIAENKRLQDKLAKAEARFNRPAKTPQNSSMPPSQGQKPNGGLKCDEGVAPAKVRRGHPGAHLMSPLISLASG
jgi:hypothetical protein